MVDPCGTLSFLYCWLVSAENMIECLFMTCHIKGNVCSLMLHRRYRINENNALFEKQQPFTLVDNAPHDLYFILLNHFSSSFLFTALTNYQRCIDNMLLRNIHNHIYYLNQIILDTICIYKPNHHQ